MFRFVFVSFSFSSFLLSFSHEHKYRVVDSGVRILISRSVVHDKVPPEPGIVRLEVLPSGFFIHPAKGGKASLVSYIMQAGVFIHQYFIMNNTSIITVIVIVT